MAQRNRILLVVAAVAVAALAILRMRGGDSSEETGSWEPI